MKAETFFIGLLPTKGVTFSLDGVTWKVLRVLPAPEESAWHFLLFVRRTKGRKTWIFFARPAQRTQGRQWILFGPVPVGPAA